jgi:hypothetical protein
MSKMTELASGAITATEMLALAARTNSLSEPAGSAQ